MISKFEIIKIIYNTTLFEFNFNESHMKKILLKNYKITKKTLLKNINIFENLSIKKILFIFPFFFGLTINFYQKYHKNSFYFLSQNIYVGEKKNEEKVSWESFNFFQLKKIKEKNIININVYQNIILLNLKKPLTLNLVGIIEKTGFSKIKKIENKNFIIKIEDVFYFSNNKTLQTTNINKISLYKNDFVPKKINKIECFDNEKKIENFFLEKNNFTLRKNDKKVFNSENISKNKIKKFKFVENNNNNKIFIVTAKQEKVSSKKISSINEQFFDNSINKVFYINNISLNKEFTNTKKFLKFQNQYNSIKKIDILKILEKNTKKYNTHKIQKRLISGYNYIDFNTYETVEFIKQRVKNKKNILKIILPTNLIIFNYSTKNILANKLLTLTTLKNGFFGTSLKKKQNKIFSTQNVLNFQKNLKPQVKKFRKIDDFYSEKIFIKFVRTENIFDKKKELSLAKFDIDLEKYVGKLFFNKKNIFYTIKKQPNLAISQKHFIQNWEYISINSWIFITKFLLVLYISYFLKEIYKDYGRELISYLLEYGKNSQLDFENLKEQYFYKDSSFRIIKKTNKNIKNISGIDSLLPEIGEIILILRYSKQIKKLKKSTPKGFLLAGAPGNGKTLLVQGIAGESKIPVIIQSGSLLINTKDQGHKKLKKIFRYAKSISPAIIFIDEIDSLGEKRKNILTNSSVNNKDIEFLYELDLPNNEYLIPKPIFNDINIHKSSKKEFFESTKPESTNFDEKSTADFETKKLKLNILTQFLIEMDGIENQTKFIVFGATNRLKTLDPAFTRPGRFNKIITLDLPSQKNRIQILKFYSKNRKIEKKISWSYLGKKTNGLTASEIASIMNESSIQAILKKTTHTIETIETGIDYITSYSNIKKKIIKNVLNFAYYQASKTIGLTFLNSKYTNLVISLSLWDRKKNTRHDKTYTTLFSQIQTKIELENLLLFFNLGKSTECIYQYGKKNYIKIKYSNSIISLEDRKIIQYISFLLVNRWYLYSINILLKEKNKNIGNYYSQNQTNYNLVLTKTLLQEFKVEKINNLDTPSNYQEPGISINWQYNIGSQVGEIKKSLIDWYRLYIPDPEERISNIDWIPPDLYIHNNITLKNLSKQSTINYGSFYKIERDFLFHSIILNSFNLASLKIEKNRELIDYFATQLLRYGIIRDNEIRNKL